MADTGVARPESPRTSTVFDDRHVGERSLGSFPEARVVIDYDDDFGSG